jgi:hypothetical protein
VKAIVNDEYGSPDDLKLQEIDMPVLPSDGVLVRVRAASVNPYDWHLMRGLPYLVRISEGLRRPRRGVPGVDVSGHVEAVGEQVTRFQPGDEVFGSRGGAFAEYVCGREKKLRAEVDRPHVRASRDRGRRGMHCSPGSSRPGTDSARTDGSDQRCGRRRGHVRRADCQGVRSRRDRCVRRELGARPRTRRPIQAERSGVWAACHWSPSAVNLTTARWSSAWSSSATPSARSANGSR